MSGKTSRSRANVQMIAGAESRLRTKSKQMFHSDLDPQALLTEERMQNFLIAGMCPYCPRGPFEQVAMHISRAHGIGPRELRDAAGMYYSASLTSMRLHDVMVRRGKQRDMGAIRGSRTGKTPVLSNAAKGAYPRARVLSEAAKQRNRAQLRRTRGKALKASAERARRDYQERLESIRPEIQRGIDEGLQYGQIADRLGLTPQMLGRYAKALGFPDGRALPASQRHDMTAVKLAAEQALERQRLADLEEWRSGDGSWTSVLQMAESRGKSIKSMRARLVSIGVAVPDGRKAATK